MMHLNPSPVRRTPAPVARPESPPEPANPKSEIVRKMFARGTPPPPEALEEVLEAIQVIPLHVLELIDRNETRIVYLKQGERPDAPTTDLLRPVDPQRFLQDPSDLHVQQALNFEQIARKAGARTPEQIRQFSEILAALNPNPPAPPELQGWLDQVPLEQRPLAGPVMVPRLFYRNDMLLDKRQADFVDVWESDRWAGYYRSDLNTLFLREGLLGKTHGGTSVPVHELGHAFGDALADLRPDLYAPLKKARDEAFTQQHFPTDYARESPSEFFAESFAVRFETGGHGLEPTWAQALENALLAGGSG